MQSVECHSKTAAVSEHCHHFAAFNEQCHISFLSNILSTISNFQQCLQKNLLEIVPNLFPFGHTQIHSMKASSRYLGLKGKHFQGYQNDFEAESISGCGAPWPRIDNAGLMPGYPKLVGAGCDNGGEKQVNYDKTTTGHQKAGLLLMTAGGSHVPTQRRGFQQHFPRLTFPSA